ncbi:MAG: NHLP bacteriocin system secretion protein [Acidobacteriota bacterium]
MSPSRRERPVSKMQKSADVAAERLSTPDQLDQVIQVASFPHWLALSSLTLVLAGAVAAGILIPVPITVRGEGILINAGGILTVRSETEGRLVELLVEPGMIVRPGQTVARVDQPQLRRAAERSREELAEARNRRETILAFHERTSRTQNQTITDQRLALEQRLDFAKSHLANLEEQLAGEEDLNRRGIISRRQLIATRAQVDEGKDEVLSVENEIKRFVQVISDQDLIHERELLESQLEISDLERQVASLEAEYESKSRVESPYGGKVVELKINRGEITGRNGALFSLLPAVDEKALRDPTVAQADELIAVLYVPPAEGKKIRSRMEVQLALSSIRREEFGFLLGRVETVAEVPATTEGMMRVLQNRQLVEQLSGTQAPFEVRVTLDRDAATPTGYSWSSSTGPDLGINVGTLCTGQVITQHERLITVVLPALGRLFDD